jgi:hypothetical protein
MTIGTYCVYLTLSIGLTIWVARTLHKNGRVFLVDAFLGNAEMADSVNHLLVVGFYLINVGFVSMTMESGVKPQTLQQAMELLSSKVGLVLFVLGIMHFFNMYNFDQFRKKGLAKKETGAAK